LERKKIAFEELKKGVSDEEVEGLPKAKSRHRHLGEEERMVEE
jgi:hypothetical protein